MRPLNVLLVTYGFPPLGGIGVMRAASLARYLPAEGIRLDVLTARNAAAVGSDPSLLAEIPDDVTVHRTLTLDIPFGIKKRIKRLVTGGASPASRTSGATETTKPKFFKRIVQDILRPDPQVTWLPVLTRAARRIVRQRNIDVVLITVPPFSTTLLVEKLRAHFPDLAIIIDFRDEWLSTTFDRVSFLFSSSERNREFAGRTEESAIQNTTAVVAVTEAARREIRSRYPGEPESKFHLIPNGFDSSRLPLAINSPRARTDDKIVVTYIGSIYTSTEPTTLVEALRTLPPDVRSRFKLRFIGHIEEPRFREALLKLEEMVELTGYLPQREALSAMAETDYVLLLNHDPLNVGGKFYEYAGSRKPILGLVCPDGESRRLLEELRAGWWAGNGDIEGIRQLFLDAMKRGIPPFADFQPNLEKIAQFERKALAQRYARLLHSIGRESLEHGDMAQSFQTVVTETW